MKILYISGDMGVDVGGRKGAATHVREACHAFTRLGHEVLLVTPCVGDRSNIHVPVHEVTPPQARWVGLDMRYVLLNRKMRREINRLVDTFKPDAVYERYSLYQTAGLEICRKRKIPRVLEVNTLLAREQAHRLHWPWLAQLVERSLWRREKAIICVSQMLKRLMVEAAGIREHQMAGLVVSPVAVDPAVFHPTAQPADLSAHVPAGAKIAGYMGTLTSWHGVDVFFEAAEILKRGEHAVVIFAVGGEPERVERLRARVKEQGLQDHLIFHGSIPFSQVPSYLAAMDVCLIADTQDWSSPTKFFEFAAMQRPVVAARCPAVEEVFGSGNERGLLFRRGDAEDIVQKLLQVLSDPALAVRVGAAARSHVLRKYTWNHNIAKILELYEKLGCVEAGRSKREILASADELAKSELL